MFIRCPKCRYRFDEPVADGITEVHSVCPLCGTPFVVAADIPEAAQPQHGHHQPTPTPQEHADTVTTDHEKPLHDMQSRSPRDQRRHGYDGIGCIVVLLLLALLVLHLCSGRATQLQQAEDSQSLGLFTADTITTDSVPQWLEGNWIGFAKGDTTTLSIIGHNLALTHSGQLISGIHRIADNKMFCTFSPDYEPVFILHPKHETIDIVLSNDQSITMMKADHYREQLQKKAIAEAERQARISSRRSAITKTTYTTPTQKKVKKKKSRRRRYYRR